MSKNVQRNGNQPPPGMKRFFRLGEIIGGESRELAVKLIHLIIHAAHNFMPKTPFNKTRTTSTQKLTKLPSNKANYIKLLIFVASSILYIPVFGQSLITAGLVSSNCKALNSDNLTTVSIANGLCTYLILGYIDGLQEGANRGLRTAYIDDAKNMSTVNGIQDMQFRISLIRAKSKCVPPQATITQVIDVFVQYVDAHPQRKEEIYTGPMIDAIESYYCPR